MVITAELDFCAETTTSRYWSHRRERDVRAAAKEAFVNRGGSWAFDRLVSNRGQIRIEGNSHTAAWVQPGLLPSEANSGCRFLFSSSSSFSLCPWAAAAERPGTTRMLRPGNMPR